jgi:hypothetical protein
MRATKSQVEYIRGEGDQPGADLYFFDYAVVRWGSSCSKHTVPCHASSLPVVPGSPLVCQLFSWSTGPRLIWLLLFLHCTIVSAGGMLGHDQEPRNDHRARHRPPVPVPAPARPVRCSLPTRVCIHVLLFLSCPMLRVFFLFLLFEQQAKVQTLPRVGLLFERHSLTRCSSANPSREVEVDEFTYSFTSAEKPNVQNDTVTLNKRFAQV